MRNYDTVAPKHPPIAHRRRRPYLADAKASFAARIVQVGKVAGARTIVHPLVPAAAAAAARPRNGIKATANLQLLLPG
jgi:hypothetical protein